MTFLNQPYREWEQSRRRDVIMRFVRYVLVMAAWFALGIGLGMWVCGH